MVDAQTEASITTFSKSGTEEGTAVQIENERKIGSGAFGTCYEADVTIGKHKRKLVIKRFYSARGEEEAANAMRNYEVAKKAGLKVFPTHRLGEDRKSILMTNGSTQTSVCIGINVDSPTTESLFGKRIEHIADEDLYKFTDEAFQQAVLAGKKGITFDKDAFFFFVDRATQSKIDFIIGDLDMVNTRAATIPGYCLPHNKGAVKEAFNDFINQNVIEPDVYKEKIIERYYR